MRKGARGFSVVELLIVIAVLGILLSVTLASLNIVRAKAANVKVQSELSSLRKIIYAGRIENNATLLEITGNGCTDCPCRDMDLRGIADTHACQISWNSAMTDLNNSVGGGDNGVTDLLRDPWGSPYGLDENEGELGPSSCMSDYLRSAGPDGTLYNADDITVEVAHSAGFSHCP